MLELNKIWKGKFKCFVNLESGKISVQGAVEEEGSSAPPRKRFCLEGSSLAGASSVLGQTSLSEVAAKSSFATAMLKEEIDPNHASGGILDQGQVASNGISRRYKGEKNGFAKGDGFADDHPYHATNGHHQGTKPKVDFRSLSMLDQEIIRLIGQHLQSMGLRYALSTKH